MASWWKEQKLCLFALLSITVPTASQTTSNILSSFNLTRHNYSEVLHMSMLYYDAQQSGNLPSSHRVPWRKSSALSDQGTKGEQLSQGWYTGGGYVKYGLPMAFAVTLLSWGIEEFPQAYNCSNEIMNWYDTTASPLTYFWRAHPSKFEFYAQVGDPDLDNPFWGRSEDMNMARPAFQVNASHPGSDVVAETAAAFAASLITAQHLHPHALSISRSHAIDLFEFADKYRGTYTDAIPQAAGSYQSWGGYGDELAWAAIWIYKATGNVSYLQRAEDLLSEFNLTNTVADEFSWSHKLVGVQMLLYEATGKLSYKCLIEQYMTKWLPGGVTPYTPLGLAYHDEYAPLSYAANTAWIAMVAAKHGIRPTQYRAWAKEQIHYMLGSTGFSYVVGYGDNYPRFLHHKSSSCPPAPAICGWSTYNNDTAPNYNILKGALVGGPCMNDSFIDKRNNYKSTMTSPEFNAGFQSAIAALLALSDPECQEPTNHKVGPTGKTDCTVATAAAQSATPATSVAPSTNVAPTPGPQFITTLPSPPTPPPTSLASTLTQLPTTQSPTRQAPAAAAYTSTAAVNAGNAGTTQALGCSLPVSAKQRSTYGEGIASYAIDGRTDTCAQSGWDKNGWFKMKLSCSVNVKGLNITGRGIGELVVSVGHEENDKGFRGGHAIHANDLCNTMLEIGPMGLASVTVKCKTAISGQFVYVISASPMHRQMNICDINVLT